MRQRPDPSHRALQPTSLAMSKLLILAITQLPIVRALPLQLTSYVRTQDEGKAAEDPSLWIYLGVAAALVLLGGAFAGLTIALMGQDEIYLQVIKSSGEDYERKNAKKVLSLLNKGKHWVLVTLLLSNVITNETLPIVLDRSLGGGWPAVLGSTVLIVIFGEIAPQSVCVRYGLPIGAWMSPFVLVLMYILAPVAWPTAKLLDYLLGEEHGTVYKKSGLKTLVSLHKTMGEAGQQLTTDEVTIISAVLDLKEKSVGTIMTPMDDVFTLSVDDVLDEDTMDMILSAGYSRIPIHTAHNDQDFVGMLLVKMLITYDPEDAKPVREFALATLPETGPETSCLDIVNFFQEGKSHMVLVSENPGGDSGVLGVVTLEDVIEELIGEEIIDESDVFIDVHKAIRRLAPAPRTRLPRTSRNSVDGDIKDEDKVIENSLVDIREDAGMPSDEMTRLRTQDAPPKSKKTGTEYGSPRGATLLLRRRSSTAASDKGGNQMRIRANTPQMREHLGHLGPSNVASRPRTTKNANIKIKPGLNTDSITRPLTGPSTPRRRVSESMSSEYQGGIGEGLLSSAGKDAKDGVLAVQTEYGTIGSGSPAEQRTERPLIKTAHTSAEPFPTIREPNEDEDAGRLTRQDVEPHAKEGTEQGKKTTSRSFRERRHNGDKSPGYTPAGPARSGSITENFVDANGIRKLVLEMTASSSSNEEEENEDPKSASRSTFGGGSLIVNLRGGEGADKRDDEEHQSQTDGRNGKKKRRRRRKNGGGKGEEEPLLEGTEG